MVEDKGGGPKVRTLSRYLVRELGRIFAASWVALASLLVLVDFFGRIDNFLSEEVPLGQVALYVAASVPQALLQTGPMAALIAAIIGIQVLSRRGELVAMRACGVSPGRILLPPLIGAVVLSLALTALSELVVPTASATASRIWDREVSGRQAKLAAGKVWYRGKRTIYSFRSISEDATRLQGVTLYLLAPRIELSSRVDARTARYTGGRWVLQDALIQEPGEDGDLTVRKLPELALRLAERPADLAAGERKRQDMSAWELWRLARRMRAEGYEATRYLVDMLARLAFPLGAAVLGGLGLSFSLSLTRRAGRQGMALGIGVGLLAAFLYWAGQAFLVSLGRTGVLPWWLAPWVADAVFAAAAGLIWLGPRRPARA
jgi:lipopolysaccharide export system permease protein